VPSLRRAPEKVGCFLLEMAERLSDDYRNEYILPVSRNDIAECLSVLVETVSRSLSGLKRREQI
jgi:CRP-like cAMP-binding protein